METQKEVDCETERNDTEAEPGIDELTDYHHVAPSVCMLDCMNHNSISESGGPNSEDEKCDVNHDGCDSGEHSQADFSYVPYNTPQDGITNVLLENYTEGNDVLEEVSRTLAGLFCDENHNVQPITQNDCSDAMISCNTQAGLCNSASAGQIETPECVENAENTTSVKWTENSEDLLHVEDNNLTSVDTSVHTNCVAKTEHGCISKELYATSCMALEHKPDTNSGTCKNTTNDSLQHQVQCDQIEFACKLQLRPNCSMNSSQPTEETTTCISNDNQTVSEDNANSLKLIEEGKEIHDLQCSSENGMDLCTNAMDESSSFNKFINACDKNLEHSQDAFPACPERLCMRIHSEGEIDNHEGETAIPVETKPLNSEVDLNRVNQISTEVTMTMDRLVEKCSEEFVGDNSNTHIISNQYEWKQRKIEGSKLSIEPEGDGGVTGLYSGCAPVAESSRACPDHADSSRINEANTEDLEKIGEPCRECRGAIACDNRKQEIRQSQGQVSTPSLESSQMQNISKEKCTRILPHIVEFCQQIPQVRNELSQAISRLNEEAETLAVLAQNTHPLIVAEENREMHLSKWTTRERRPEKCNDVGVCSTEAMHDDVISGDANVLNSDLSSQNVIEVSGEQLVIDDSSHGGNRKPALNGDEIEVSCHHTGAQSDADIFIEGIDCERKPPQASDIVVLTDLCARPSNGEQFPDNADEEPDTLTDSDGKDTVKSVCYEESVLQSVTIQSETGTLSEENMERVCSIGSEEMNTMDSLQEKKIPCESKSNVNVMQHDISQSEQNIENHISEKELRNDEFIESVASISKLENVTEESSIPQTTISIEQEVTVPSIVHHVTEKERKDPVPCCQIASYYMPNEDFQFLCTQPFTASVSNASIADFLQGRRKDDNVKETSQLALESDDHRVPCGSHPHQDGTDVTMYDDNEQPHFKEKLSAMNNDFLPQTPSFRWKYAPSLDLENIAPMPTEPSHDADSVLTVLPLKNCTRPIRIGLSKRYRAKPLHGRNYKL